MFDWIAGRSAAGKALAARLQDILSAMIDKWRQAISSIEPRADDIPVAEGNREVREAFVIFEQELDTTLTEALAAIDAAADRGTRLWRWSHGYLADLAMAQIDRIPGMVAMKLHSDWEVAVQLGQFQAGAIKFNAERKVAAHCQG